MKNLALMMTVLFISINSFSQTEMKIRKTDGSIYSIPISEVDSVYYELSSAFPCGNQVTDIDGNLYNTVSIGGQCWIAENLKVTHYPNGDAIPLVTSSSEFDGLLANDVDDAYSYYNNNTSNEADTYGALYTYAAAIADDWQRDNAPDQGVCPDGWHIPTDVELKTLQIALGMSTSDADALGWQGTNEGSKLAGNSDLWNAGDLETDAEFGSSGFSLLPSGYRSNDGGNFTGLGSNTSFWSSTEGDLSHQAYRRALSNGNKDIYRGTFTKSSAFPVRCVGN